MVRASLATAALVLGATASGASGGVGDPWPKLHRPLQFPRVEAGDPCPTSVVDGSVDFAKFGIGIGLGRGPAYPVGLSADGKLTLAAAANFGSRRWLGQKVLWFVLPRYRGPALVRGRQLDGAGLVRFGEGALPSQELRIRVGESVSWTHQPRGARGFPSYTRLRGPGCYAYQVDGTSFSRVIVFRAVRGS